MRKEVVVAATAVAGLTAAAVLWYRRSMRRWNKAYDIVGDFRIGCATPVWKLWDVADAMAAEMAGGLETEGGSCLRMIVSEVGSLPTGTEKGQFYGVALGRTNVRFLCVQLGAKEPRVIKKEITEVPMPSYVMVGTSEELYDFIAAELSKFISSMDESSSVEYGKPKDIGVTVSFPVVQTSTPPRTIIEWTQGFSIKETVQEGRDSVLGMNMAMEKHGVKMHVSSLVNDSIGTLFGGRYFSSDTVVAVILGMRTNASYIEPLHSVRKWSNSHSKQEELIINMEWGNFKSMHLPITEFDAHLDAEGPNSGKQIFEKLISGMHLGDIVRRVLLKVAEATSLFGDIVPQKLKIPYILRTSDVASMHQDTTHDLVVVREKLAESLGIYDTTLSIREIVLEVCDIVAKRAARLAGAGIVGILKKLGRDGTDKKSTVAMEGGLYEHYRLYRNYLHDAVREMLQEKFLDNVVINQLSDEHRIGAALLAATSKSSDVSGSS